MAFLLALLGVGVHTSNMTIDKEELNKAVDSVVVKITTKQDENLSFTQNIRVNNGRFLHCVPDFNQSMDINVTTVQEFTSNLTSELIKKLKQTVDTQIDNKMAPKQTAFSGVQVTVTSTKMKDRTHNIIENLINIDYLNEQVKRVNASQTGQYSNTYIDACPGYDENLKLAIQSGKTEMVDSVRASCNTNQKCPLAQDFKAVILTRQIVNALTDAIVNDETIQNLNTQIKNDVKPVMEFATLGGGLSSCCCCVLCILIIAVTLYFMWDSDTTKQGITTAGNVYKPMPSPMMPPK